MTHAVYAYCFRPSWQLRKCLIYNIRNPEQDQTAIFRQIWQYRLGMKDGLFDNPNGGNATCRGTEMVEKNLMYGRDKMCLKGKTRKGSDVSYRAPRKSGLAKYPCDTADLRLPISPFLTRPITGGTPCTPRPLRSCSNQSSPAPWSCATPPRGGAS